MKTNFLSILEQSHEGLHFLHKYFRNKKQFKRPPTALRDFKSENILFLNFDHIVICDFAMSTQIQ